jgi:hypothetical protein
MINFPTSPVNGATYIIGNITYTYSSITQAWSAANSFTGPDLITNNRIIVRNTTNSVSTNTGAITVTGGVGIGNDLTVGGLIYGTLAGGTPSADTAVNLAGGTAGQTPYQSTASVTDFYGPGVEGDVLVSGGGSAPRYQNTLTLASLMASTSTNTGALTVAGGVGVGGDIYSAGGSDYYNYLLYTPRVTVSDTAPVDPRIGDFWIDPEIGVEYQYVPNGESAVWIQFMGL